MNRLDTLNPLDLTPHRTRQVGAESGVLTTVRGSAPHTMFWTSSVAMSPGPTGTALANWPGQILPHQSAPLSASETDPVEPQPSYSLAPGNSIGPA